MAGFNAIDITLLVIVLISIVCGIARGGIREIFSLLAWVAAWCVAAFFAHPIAAHFSAAIAAHQGATAAAAAAPAATAGSLFVVGASFCLLFFAVLLVGTLLGHVISKAVEGSGGVSLANHLLGGLIGFGKGCLSCLLLVFIVQLTPLAEQPAWKKSAIVQPVQPTVQWLAKRVEPHIEAMKAGLAAAEGSIETHDPNTSSAMPSSVK